MELAIEANGLRKSYPGGVEAVKGIDFEVAVGEVFGLLARTAPANRQPSGCHDHHRANERHRQDRELRRRNRAARDPRRSSVVFQEPALDRSLTGRRHLEIHARLWGVRTDETGARIEELSETLGLTDSSTAPPVAIAAASGAGWRSHARSSHTPRVLFLDEPTVGLDPRIRAELLEVIAGLGSRSELTVLLTTHYLDEAERLCDRIAIIQAGRIVALDTPRALLSVLGAELVELRVEGNVTSALASLRERGVAGEDAFAVGSRLTVPLHDRSSQEAIAAVHELGLAGSISARKPTLDDVYLSLTGDSLAAAA